MVAQSLLIALAVYFFLGQNSGESMGPGKRLREELAWGTCLVTVWVRCAPLHFRLPTCKCTILSIWILGRTEKKP